MPKPIREQVPSSSIAKLFDVQAAALAVQSPAAVDVPSGDDGGSAERHTSRINASSEDSADPRHTHHRRVRSSALSAAIVTESVASRQHVASHSEGTRGSAQSHNDAFRPSLAREFKLTPGTDATVEWLVDLFREQTRTRLTASHVARALLKAVHHAKPEIERAAKQLQRLKLPSKSREAELERERFEARIADVIVAGMRAAAVYRDVPSHDGDA
jgi:hypothetical protein